MGIFQNQKQERLRTIFTKFSQTHGSMKKNGDQEENLDQQINVNESQDSPINKGEEFMRLRRVKKEIDPEPVELMPTGGKQMNTAIMLTLTIAMTLGGTLLGFLFGWFANVYYSNFMETMQTAIGVEDEEEIAITPHPEMLDRNGNMIPFQIAKLVSVEFEPSDAFDMDPFPESDDD
jgi:hypothetical protein